MLEIALFIPILFTLLVGMVQIGKITYVYYTLRKTLYTMGRFVAAQQGVNFCDDGDAAILAAKNFALSGTSSDDGTEIRAYCRRRRRGAGRRRNDTPRRLRR